MISTYAMQEIFANRNDWIGFSISPTSGSVRLLAYRLRKSGVNITLQDIVETLRYMFSRGWLRESGQWGDEKLYSVIRGANKS